MYKDDIVKLKENVDGSLWSLEKDKEYIVVETKWHNKETGQQDMLILRNKKGKKRRYYEHLFEKVIMSKNPLSENKVIKDLKDIWMKNDSEESRGAFAKLKEMEKEWEETIPKVKDKIKFTCGISKIKYPNKEFTIKKIIECIMFEKIILLKELRGSFKLSELVKIK